MEGAGRIFLINNEYEKVGWHHQALEKHGYEVFSTNNPYKLIKYAPELNPQMYVMDMDTENIDSWEVMHYLCDHAYTETAPVVMLNVPEKANSEKGASHYLGRQYSCRRLLKIADAYIRGGKEYQMLLVEDYSHQSPEDLAEVDTIRDSCFKVYDSKAANIFLKNHNPQIVAVHSRKENYDKIRSFLHSDNIFYIEGMDNIKDLIAILH